MFKNYLKIAARNLFKYKGYSLINIGGLAIGIACCLLITLWVIHELSYDRFHADADHIYRVAEIFREDGKIVEESAGIPFPIGVISGIYPALFLSSYMPIESLGLKSNSTAGSITAFFRKGLVVFQFCISIALLIGTAVIHQQHRFLQQKELGFDKEQIVMIPIRGTTIKTKVESFKARLRQDAGVIGASAISNVIGRDVQVCPFRAEGKTEILQMPGLFVDHDFMKTFKESPDGLV